MVTLDARVRTWSPARSVVFAQVVGVARIAEVDRYVADGLRVVEIERELVPVSLIVPGPEPEEPTTVVPLPRWTLCPDEVRFSGPPNVTPLSVPPAREGDAGGRRRAARDRAALRGRAGRMTPIRSASDLNCYRSPRDRPSRRNS